MKLHQSVGEEGVTNSFSLFFSVFLARIYLAEIQFLFYFLMDED